MNNIEFLLNLANKAAIEAGKKTLDYYGKPFDVVYKADNSPLTEADIASNDVINGYLSDTKIPVLSEENEQVSYTERMNWELLWVVDPLDGTKEFVKESKEYTVNIALVSAGKPILGVVYAPVLDILFYGAKDIGAFKIENASLSLSKDKSQLVPTYKENSLKSNIAKKLPMEHNLESTIVVASKSHRTSETNNFIRKIESKLSDVEILSYGSSLKLCMVAEGSAHIYPRLAPTMEWDTAASHAIVEASGCKIVRYPEFTPLSYNKKNLLNPWFIVFCPDKEKYIK